MYQEFMCLIDLVEPETAKKLSGIASRQGWRKINHDKAIDMGYEELANWSNPQTDILVLVGEKYLVCLNKNVSTKG